MSDDQPVQRRPLLPLMLLHTVVAGVCFAWFTIVPIVASLILISIDGDRGGPMFIPFLIVSAIVFAAIITAFLVGAVLVSDLVRRRYQFPLWLAPFIVVVLVSLSLWLLFPSVHPAGPPIVGCIVGLAFIVYWSAISTAWFLPRLLFRLSRVQYAAPQG